MPSIRNLRQPPFPVCQSSAKTSASRLERSGSKCAPGSSTGGMGSSRQCSQDISFGENAGESWLVLFVVNHLNQVLSLHLDFIMSNTGWVVVREEIRRSYVPRRRWRQRRMLQHLCCSSRTHITIIDGQSEMPLVNVSKTNTERTAIGRPTWNAWPIIGVMTKRNMREVVQPGYLPMEKTLTTRMPPTLTPTQPVQIHWVQSDPEASREQPTRETDLGLSHTSPPVGVGHTGSCITIEKSSGHRGWPSMELNSHDKLDVLADFCTHYLPYGVVQYPDEEAMKALESEYQGDSHDPQRMALCNHPWGPDWPPPHSQPTLPKWRNTGWGHRWSFTQHGRVPAAAGRPIGHFANLSVDQHGGVPATAGGPIGHLINPSVN